MPATRWIITTILRLILDLIVLIVVWRNAHWSVALVLTGLSGAVELMVIDNYVRRFR